MPTWASCKTACLKINANNTNYNPTTAKAVA